MSILDTSNLFSSFSILGLLYIHEQKAIHRDIKAGNLLISSSGVVKIGDFGISTRLTDSITKRKTVIGTPYWYV